MHKKLGEDKPEQLTPTDHRVLLSHSHQAQHTELGKEGVRGREDIQSVFPSHTCCSPAFLGMAEHLPWELGESLVLLACAAFAFPIRLSLSQPTSSLTFTLPILSPIPPGGSQLCGADSPAGDKPQHFYSLNKTFLITGKMYTLTCKIMKYTKMKAAVRMQLSISILHLVIRTQNFQNQLLASFLKNTDGTTTQVIAFLMNKRKLTSIL